MKETLAIAIPCRADEPGLGATLASLWAACGHAALPAGLVQDLVVCINGAAEGIASEPLRAVRNFCLSHELVLEEVWIASGGLPYPGSRSLEERELMHAKSPLTSQDGEGVSGSPVLRCSVLLTERRGKPPAWNILWRWTKSAFVLFSDADVRVESEAVYYLWDRFQQEPQLQLVAAREVPVLKRGGTIWSRMGALPYRFNFGNAGGRLLLLRKTILPNGIPENLLLEDAWLTVAVGKHAVAKEMRAQVFFLPPATGRDYFAERVRTEGGKLQIRRLYRELLADGPIAHYSWSHFWREIRLIEYPLVFFSLLIRCLARVWARLSLTRKDFYALYRPFTSTKGWGSPSS